MKYIIMLIVLFTFTSLDAKVNYLEHSYNIMIRTVEGEKITLEVHQSYTIENIKHQILGKTDILPEKQIIVYKGIQLENSKKLQDYKIEKNITLFLVIKKD